MADQRGDLAGRRTVDLTRSRAPRAFRDEQNLWREDLKRIYRLVGRHHQALEEFRQSRRVCEGEETEEAPHLSIAIFGPSGSGKSSLLRTLADDVDRRQPGGLAEELKLRDNVCSLRVIDPTTWASSDQFLYAFLAGALEEERERQDRKDHGIPQGLSPVQLAFQEVNEYLRVVDDPGNPEEHDPLGLSLQKLERHTSGLRLRGALGKFVKALAKELESKIVLLPVDDLDMAPDHLVKSLQDYQSFLTHPNLVPVFTFTDRMPEELLEVYFLSRLEGTQAAHRGEGGTERLSISEKLAVQFLARCFPVRNRIRLGPAPARVQRAIVQIRPDGEDKAAKKEEHEVLELLTTSSFLLFGHPDAKDAHKVRAALRPSTLRRQFQVVDAMADCRLRELRTPQFAVMARTRIKPDQLKELLNAGLDKQESIEWEFWKSGDPERPCPKAADRLREFWHEDQILLLGDGGETDQGKPTTVLGRAGHGYLALTVRLYQLQVEATWASIFNGAAWSLLNVHRDTLRELGLFLEDLYSYSPKELRSVVLDRILSRGRITRRTVLDRWFNRTDYRRSQVLSLLAANIFRPWMTGEEPYGDEELPLHEQMRLEEESRGTRVRGGLDDWQRHKQSAGHERHQIRERLTFPATQGLLWFLNVTLGFYLPQILARNWSDAMASDEPVRQRMNGNGWDLNLAPVNAMRVADTRQEIFAFGMLFLDARSYRHALELAPLAQVKARSVELQGLLAQIDKQLKTVGRRRQAQLKLEQQIHEEEAAAIAERVARAEACLGAWSSGDKPPTWRGHLLLRIWSCCGYSKGRLWAAFSLWRGLGFLGQVLELALRERERVQRLVDNASCPEDPDLAADQGFLLEALSRLIRSHCLSGMVPGALLDRGSDEERLLGAFPKWDSLQPGLSEAIDSLAVDLVRWLERCWEDRIFPLPAGKVWVGWQDCFIRRVHGEYILGALWPRLNGAYLEDQGAPDACHLWARKRCLGEDEEDLTRAKKIGEEALRVGERFRWTAAVAAGAWSDILLEYWRGCPSILRLLLTCPAFFKSREHFGPDREGVSLTRILQTLQEGKGKAPGALNDDEKACYRWLERLSLPKEAWRRLKGDGLWTEKGEDFGLVPEELCIERVALEDFVSPPITHHAVQLKPTAVKFENGEGTARSAPRTHPLDRGRSDSKPREEP